MLSKEITKENKSLLALAGRDYENKKEIESKSKLETDGKIGFKECIKNTKYVDLERALGVVLLVFFATLGVFSRFSIYIITSRTKKNSNFEDIVGNINELDNIIFIISAVVAIIISIRFLVKSGKKNIQNKTNHTAK